MTHEVQGLKVVLHRIVNCQRMKVIMKEIIEVIPNLVSVAEPFCQTEKAVNKRKRKTTKVERIIESESGSESDSSRSSTQSSDGSSSAGMSMDDHMSTSSTTAHGLGNAADVIDSIMGGGSTKLIRKGAKKLKSDMPYPCSSIVTNVRGNVSSYKLDQCPRRGRRSGGTQQDRGDLVIQSKIWEMVDLEE